MIVVLISLGCAAAIVGIYMMIVRAQAIKMQDTKIYEDELARQRALELPISLSLLEAYGFKIHDTKDKIYALNGGISMTHIEGGNWETEIQAPGRMLWRDTHYTIGQLLDFCEKHNVGLEKEVSDG